MQSAEIRIELAGCARWGRSSEVVVFKLISIDQMKSFKPRFRGINFPGKNSCVEVWEAT